MIKGVRKILVALFALILVLVFVTGCTRYAKEEQLNTLDETENAALAAEQAVADLEKEKAELQEKLAEKQEELKKVQAEKAKIEKRLGQ
jgi:hypothetical protein